MAILKYNKIKLTANQTKETRMIPFLRKEITMKTNSDTSIINGPPKNL